jgi:CRISPR-associated protein Csb2
VTALTLTVRFPLGQFNATGQGQAMEWPPSPSRVQAALIATAGTARDADGMAAARSTYGWSAPTIVTPPVGDRGLGNASWIPTQQDRETGVDKQLSDRKPGVLLDPEAVIVYRWDAAPVDLDVLQRVAAAVPFLGRPTSPAVLTFTTDILPAPVDGDTVWTPGPGAHLIGVGDEAHLAELDKVFRWRQKDDARNPGTSNRPVARDNFISYSSSVTSSSRAAIVTPAASVVDALIEQVTVVGLSGADAAPADARALLGTIGSQTSRPVLPVFGAVNGSPRLFGAVIFAVAPEAHGLPLLTSAGSVAETAIRTTVSPAFRRHIQAAASTASTWTTSAPIPNNAETAMADIRALCDTHNASISAASTHDAGLTAGQQDVGDRPDLTHATIRFNEPVTGPLFICGVVLLPFQESAAHAPAK